MSADCTRTFTSKENITTYTETKNQTIRVDKPPSVSDGTVSATVGGVSPPIPAGDVVTSDQSVTVDAKVASASDVTAANVTVGGGALTAVKDAASKLAVETNVGTLTINGDALEAIADNATVGSTVTDNDGDRITLTDKDTGYSDVSASAWYADAVAYVTDNGMMQGNAGRFMPNDNLDRAMMAQILYNLEDNPAVSGGSAFGDVGSGSWYADAVAWASANSVITGYDNGNYGPNDSITREQMALMLYRYAALKGYDTTQSGAGLTGFADAESVSSWASEAMTWAVNAGVINGKDGNRLDPQGTATRAEVAQVLMNFGQNVMP